MNDATQARRALATRAAVGYIHSPKVAAVALAGSVARGWADRHSDVELDVYWAAPPTDDERVAAITAAGGKIDVFWSDRPTDDEYRRIFVQRDGKVSQLWPLEGMEWSEHFYVGNINIGVSGFLASTAEQYLDDVLLRRITDDEQQMRLAAIQHAVPLHGAALIEGWQARAAHYPRELAAALINEQLLFDDDWWAIDMWVARDAQLPLIQLLHDMQIKTLRILLALNRLYLPDPRFKWAARLIEGMSLRPEQLAERLRQVFRLEGDAAARAMATIFDETLELVEQAHPEVDVDFARRWYRQRRPVNP